MLRNRRTVIFSARHAGRLLLHRSAPARRTRTQSAGNGNVAAYIMVSMALYGAMLVRPPVAVRWSRWSGPWAGAASCGSPRSAHGVHRREGGRRHGSRGPVGARRLPRPALLRRPHGRTAVGRDRARRVGRDRWSSPRFGVFMGYLLPSENVMQVLGPGLALFAFLGGLFVPLDQMGEHLRDQSPSSPRCTASASSCTHR